MYNFLLEVFSEEIPHNLQHYGADSLRNLIIERLKEAKISFKETKIYYTPRRLCVYITHLAEFSDDVIIRRKGPNINANDQAKQGFLRNVGLEDLSQLQIVDEGKKGKFYVAEIVEKGQKIQPILKEILPSIFKEVNWPKSMRWENALDNMQPLRWIRPIRNLLCIIYKDPDSTEIIDFKLGSLIANDRTYGHRFLSKRKCLKIKNFEQYIKQLNSNYVILDPLRRINEVELSLKLVAKNNKLYVVEDIALIKEVANLVEYPHILLGKFPKEFLSLPAQVIETTIKQNQKCFVTFIERPVQGKAPKLSNYFLICSNMRADDGGAKIIKGNERVVSARLSDAMFFYKSDCRLLGSELSLDEKDKKTIEALQLDLNKPLDQRIALAVKRKAIFYKNLGTQAQQLLRIKQLSVKIAQAYHFTAIEDLERAAILCKSDLLTEMVNEFPNLHGYMGARYAKLQKENQNICKFIEQSANPLQRALLRENSFEEGYALACAMRIDLLVGFWLINEKPNGSRDPFALRRAALQLAQILLYINKSLDLQPIIKYAIDLYLADLNREYDKEQISNLLPDLIDFISERYKIFKKQQVNYDIIEASCLNNLSNVWLCEKKIYAILNYIHSINAAKFLQINKRVENILADKKHCFTDFNPALIQQKEEQILIDTIARLNKKIEEHLAIYDYSSALAELQHLTQPTIDFFDKVRVNVENAQITKNRLALLNEFYNLSHKIADFSKIVVK